MSLSSLIKLAENPLGDDFDYEDEDGGDEFGYEDEGGADDGMDDMAFKGRSVSGPRTKLASEDTDVRELITSLAKSVNALAQVQKAMLDKSEWFEDEEAETKENPDPNLDKGKVSKDDAAGGSFGEKDSALVGNRPWDPEDVGKDDTVIQGGPSAGPGPVSKAEPFDYNKLEAMINRSVAKALKGARATSDETLGRIVSKAEAPGIGTTSKVEKSYDEDSMMKELSGRSFKQIADLRIKVGDLTGGIL